MLERAATEGALISDPYLLPDIAPDVCQFTLMEIKKKQVDKQADEKR